MSFEINKKVLREALFLLEHNMYAKINNDPEDPKQDWFILSRVMPKKDNRYILSNEDFLVALNALNMSSLNKIYLIKMATFPFVQAFGNREEIMKEIELKKLELK